MFIYKAKSKTTNKVYIGQSSQPLQHRINQHNSHAYSSQSNYHFHNAIRKYGPDDFEYEIIEDNIDNKDLLNEREKYWIEYYDSYNNGYNSTIGGDGSVRRDDKIIKQLFDEGKTTNEICELTGYSRDTIYRAYQILGISKDNKERVNKQNGLRCARSVLQYDLEGNFIKRWESATQCGAFFGNQSLVSMVCRMEQSVLTAYGFLFKYEDDPKDISEWVKRYKNKQDSGKPKKRIGQFDIDGILIQEFASGADAARALNKKDGSKKGDKSIWILLEIPRLSYNIPADCTTIPNIQIFGLGTVQ